jgi:hypothetical protein
MGIETPDTDLLIMTQKQQNATKPIVDRVQKMYRYGFNVIGSFIIGFDNEKKHLDEAMIKLIEDTGINMAFVGLLVALPNTQLSRRLAKERRLLSLNGQFITDAMDIVDTRARVADSIDVFDNSVAGLNFVTTRHRWEIYAEYSNIIRRMYDVDSYFDRAVRLAKALKIHTRHRPGWFEIKRRIMGLINISKRLLKMPHIRWRFLRTFAMSLRHGIAVTEEVCRVIGMYIHFEKQSAFMLRNNEEQMTLQKDIPPEFLSLESLNKRREDSPGWIPQAAYPYIYGGKALRGHQAEQQI